MGLEAIITATWEQATDRFATTSDKRKVVAEMVRILVEDEGYFVAENAKDLREQALGETDLVEPTDE